MRKAGWQESSTGPDWIDVIALQEAVQGIHDCHVEWTTRTVTHGAGAVLSTTVLAWVDSVEAHQVKELASVTFAWPNKTHTRFNHAVYEALFKLDVAIGKAYVQKTISE